MPCIGSRKYSKMATSQVETVNTGADKAKLAAVVALVIASVAGFYLLGKQGAVVQWAALIVGLAAAAGVFLVSESGRQFVAFAKDAWREVKKVVWPTRKETLQMTAYVFAFVVIMALFLWFTDKTLEWVLYDLILGWRKSCQPLRKSLEQKLLQALLLRQIPTCVGTLSMPTRAWKRLWSATFRSELVARVWRTSLVAFVCGSAPTRGRCLWGGRKSAVRRFRKGKSRKSSARCRKAQTSLATRSNSWWANLFVSKKVLSPTSMVRLKRSITKRAACGSP